MLLPAGQLKNTTSSLWTKPIVFTRSNSIVGVTAWWSDDNGSLMIHIDEADFVPPAAVGSNDAKILPLWIVVCTSKATVTQESSESTTKVGVQ